MFKNLFLFLFLIFYIKAWNIHIKVQNNSIFIQNKKILQILTYKDGIPPHQRIKNIKKNLKNAYLDSICLIKIVNKNSFIHFLVNDHFIASISLKEAKKQNCSQKKLAEQWKKNLLQAIYQPPFSFTKENFLVPECTSIEIKVLGNNPQGVQISNSTPDILDVIYKQNTLHIYSKKIGKGIITAELGTYKKVLSLEVLPLAAVIPDQINTYIVGQNHSITKLHKIIHQNIHKACRTVPLAKINTFFNPIKINSFCKLHFTKVFVTIEAPNTIPVTKYVTVAIKNLGMPHKIDKMLWYCNDPESIKQFGDIDSVKLDPGFPTRVLFHHVNSMPHKLGVQFLIKNHSDHPAKLILIHGEGDPHIDPVKVGQEAAKRFIRTYHNNLGDVIEIPANNEIPLVIQKLNRNETMSGLFSICLIPSKAQNVYITAQALSIYELENLWKNSLEKPFPWHTADPIPITRKKESWRLSHHVFPTPHKTINIKYQAGGPFCFIRLGEIPIKNITQKVLEGNFGVMYQIQASINNPTSNTVSVEAVFEASAGYSSGVFIVNNQLETAPLLPSKKEFILKKITLSPFQQSILNITTLPISGSSYPATIIIRPVTKY